MTGALRRQPAEVLARVVGCERLAEQGGEVGAVVVQAHVVAEEVAARERRPADVERAGRDSLLLSAQLAGLAQFSLLDSQDTAK